MPEPARRTSLAALKRQRARRLARVGAKALYLYKRGRKQETYNLVCNEFLSLGGVYIKFLQGVLYNTDFVRQWQSPNRLKIFEHIDQDPIDIVATLKHELSPEQLQAITGVQTQPFAAGSFGQVYLGRHANGKLIVIKALRPQVSELLRFDLRLLGIFSKQLTSQQFSGISIKMGDSFKEFRTATLNETDYLAEAALAHSLYEGYRGHPYIVIPETYLDLCTKTIIVQEYIGGISGAELTRLKQEQGIDAYAYIKQELGSDLHVQLCKLGVEYLTGTFKFPKIQGDPHAGNIRFLPGNKVSIIDFGVSASPPRNQAAFLGIIEQWDQLNNHQPVHLSGIFEQYMRYFSNDFYRSLKRLSGFIPRGQSSMTDPAEILLGNQQDIVEELCDIVEKMVRGAIGAEELQEIINQGYLGTVLGQTINRGGRLGIELQIQSSEILRAWQTYVSILGALENHRQETLPYVFAEAAQYLRDNYPQLLHASDKPISVTRAIDIVNHWLERIAVRDPALFQQIFSHINGRLSGAELSEYDAKEATDNA